jgi:hypothetical protein
MIDTELLHHILDSLAHPYVFCDLDHVIRYMNRPGIDHYAKRGGDALIGTNVLDCHGPASRATMLDIFDRMRDQGLDEELITDSSRWRIYMRAVRDDQGALLGYYERYEPPRGA